MKKTNSTTTLAIAAIRSLLIDVINRANSGHPGMALDATPAMVALFRDHLVSDPKHPTWENRDRFVLSSGHVSALLYSMLHVCGYKLSMEDLQSFRQLGSLTPGHPEFGLTDGVDATSGPLGQGIAQAVGMAMAEAHLAAKYPDSEGFMRHYTYVLCGDGCLEEGISQEAISLAGLYRLERLILMYDANGATLDGPTGESTEENVELRFLAAGWNTIRVKNGDDPEAISKAISKAKADKNHRPTLILFHTTIGIGSKNAGLSKTHGAPLGEEDGAYAKHSYGFDEPPFTVPSEVYALFASTFAKRGAEAYEKSQKALLSYAQTHKEYYQQYKDSFDRNFTAYLPKRCEFEAKKEATRVSSGKYLEKLYASLPFTFGGSADVAGSTKTNVKGSTMFGFAHPEGRDVHFGIREFGMASAVNGAALHGGVVPYCATFFVFSDYCKPALRMAAMEKIPSVYLFTHDSLAVGEDGATHEPIEQLASLRSIPGLDVIRPSDKLETEAAWELAVTSKDHPTAIVLTRQDVPALEASSFDGVAAGAYFVRKTKGAVGEILATGSEVSLALEAADILKEEGIVLDVVSLPSFYRFEKLGEEEKEKILCFPRSARVSLEMASTFGWAKYAEHNIGIDEYGASGKEKDVYARFGFTKEAVAAKIREIFQKKGA